jgi:hypothetical protein
MQFAQSNRAGWVLNESIETLRMIAHTSLLQIGVIHQNDTSIYECQSAQIMDLQGELGSRQVIKYIKVRAANLRACSRILLKLLKILQEITLRANGLTVRDRLNHDWLAVPQIICG